MNRDEAYLLDIINAINRIQLFAKGLTKDDLRTNEEKQSAILYQIIILGEATKRLSPEFKASHLEIPWQDIAGMRDILAHQYDRININILWDVVQKEAIELKKLITPLLPDTE